jgi:hypothetical protein
MLAGPVFRGKVDAETVRAFFRYARDIGIQVPDAEALIAARENGAPGVSLSH